MSYQNSPFAETTYHLNADQIDRMEWNVVKSLRSSKNQKLLLILRGLPGSGKTTLGREMIDRIGVGIQFETDQFFVGDDGKYRFDVTRLTEAHETTKRLVQTAMKENLSPFIVISNTFTEVKEFLPYAQFADTYGFALYIHDVHLHIRKLYPQLCPKPYLEYLVSFNSHDVPWRTMKNMILRYEHLPHGITVIRGLHHTVTWPDALWWYTTVTIKQCY